MDTDTKYYLYGPIAFAKKREVWYVFLQGGWMESLVATRDESQVIRLGTETDRLTIATKHKPLETVDG